VQCFICHGEVYWGGDHDGDELGVPAGIVSNYTCSDCQAMYVVYQTDDPEELEIL